DAAGASIGHAGHNPALASSLGASPAAANSSWRSQCRRTDSTKAAIVFRHSSGLSLFATQQRPEPAELHTHVLPGPGPRADVVRIDSPAVRVQYSGDLLVRGEQDNGGIGLACLLELVAVWNRASHDMARSAACAAEHRDAHNQPSRV